MRQPLRILGTAMIAVGVLALAWAVLVWQWQDPFTALYTHWQQHKLAGQYRQLVDGYRPPAGVKAGSAAGLTAEKRAVAAEAGAFT